MNKVMSDKNCTNSKYIYINNMMPINAIYNIMSLLYVYNINLNVIY